MRGFVLAAIVGAALGACGPDGIYVEVQVPSGMSATTVDLYLGTALCGDEDGFDCSAIVGPRLDVNSARDAENGQVFFIDDDTVFSSEVADGSAWFLLEPGAADAIKSAIAVGRTGDVASGVVIFERFDLDVSPQHRRAELRPIIDDRVRGMAPALEIWRSDGDAYRCVAADVDGRVVYIVPRADPDCDQVDPLGEIKECDAGEYLANEPPGTELDELSCATTRSNDSVCVLGDRGCDETRIIAATQCVVPTTQFCVPDRLCACPDAGDSTCLDAAIGDPLLGGGTHIECVFETESVSGGSGRRTCPGKNANGDVLGTRACFTPEISKLGNRFAGFATSILAPTAAGDITLTPIAEGSAGGVCRIGLFAPDATLAFDPQLPIRTLVKVDVDPTAPGQRLVILPLLVTFQDGSCLDGLETACKLVRANNEHVEDCFPQ